MTSFTCGNIAASEAATRIRDLVAEAIEEENIDG